MSFVRINTHNTSTALSACDRMVASAAPATPICNPITNAISSTIFVRQLAIRKYNGLLESPTARRMPAPIYRYADPAVGGQQRQSTYEDEESVRRRAAANFVQSGHYQEAMNVLNSLSQKNGEWYYISSMANMGMGNNVKALEHIREAVRLEPNNQQYRMLLNRMEGGGSWYETQQGPFGGMPVAGDDMCLKLCLANALCGMCCPGSGVLCC